jgi:hypothetical protein
MEAMAQEWTEGRLDELSSKVDKGFERVDKGFERVDRRFEQVEQRFEPVNADVNALRSEMKESFDRIDGRIDSVQRTIAFGAVALTGAILAGFAAICTLLAAAL